MEKNKPVVTAKINANIDNFEIFIGWSLKY
jgi:hypothetical protein